MDYIASNIAVIYVCVCVYVRGVRIVYVTNNSTSFPSLIAVSFLANFHTILVLIGTVCMYHNIIYMNSDSKMQPLNCTNVRDSYP